MDSANLNGRQFWIARKLLIQAGLHPQLEVPFGPYRGDILLPLLLPLPALPALPPIFSLQWSALDWDEFTGAEGQLLTLENGRTMYARKQIRLAGSGPTT
jgi:hypothetical protein